MNSRDNLIHELNILEHKDSWSIEDRKRVAEIKAMLSSETIEKTTRISTYHENAASLETALQKIRCEFSK